MMAERLKTSRMQRGWHRARVGATRASRKSRNKKQADGRDVSSDSMTTDDSDSDVSSNDVDETASG